MGIRRTGEEAQGIITRLQDEIIKAPENDAVRDKLVSLGAVVEPTDAAQFGKFLANEIDKWAAVIKAAGITEE